MDECLNGLMPLPKNPYGEYLKNLKNLLAFPNPQRLNVELFPALSGLLLLFLLFLLQRLNVT
jgi:hypothetical protein